MNCLFCKFENPQKPNRKFYDSRVDGFNYRYMCNHCKYYLYRKDEDNVFLMFIKENSSEIALIVVIENKLEAFSVFKEDFNEKIPYISVDSFDTININKIKDKIDNINLLG